MLLYRGCVLHRRALKFVELLFEGERGKIASGGKAGTEGMAAAPGSFQARPSRARRCLPWRPVHGEG